MKWRLLISYFILFVSLILTVTLSASGIFPDVMLGCAIISLVFSVFVFRSWLVLLKQLVIKSNIMLSKHDEPSHRPSLNNIDLLNQNYDLVAEKFRRSAVMITNLSHPEKIISSDLELSDPIAKALHSIKDEMLKIKDEDEQRAWTTNGLEHISGVLRNKVEIKTYCHQIISSLVKYIQASQGGLYLEYESDEKERYLEILGSYAKERNENWGARIFEGEGLLGQCMRSHSLIVMDNVPGTYVKITSGLGESLPKFIIIVPLIFKEKFFGAIELALFKKVEPHQIEFLRNVCESIASEIAALKNIERTNVLLEESNTMSRELQSREEEMRQNLEELTATQEEMERNQLELSNTIKEAERGQIELKSYLNGINNTVASAEFDLRGRFKDGNEIFLKVMGHTKEELLDKHFEYLMGDDHSIIMMWENLKLGKFFSGEFKMKDKYSKDVWLTGTFNPITIDGQVPEKIIMFAQFTTLEKEKLSELNAMVHALKSTLPVIEFLPDFTCKTANEKAMKIFGISRMQLRSKNIYDFVAPMYHRILRQDINEWLHHDFTNVVLPFSCGDRTANYQISISVSKNANGIVGKVIVLLVKEVLDEVSYLAVV